MKSMTPKQRTVLAAAICLLPVAGLAQDVDELSYGYVEADYINLDIDQPGEDNAFEGDWDNGDGFGVTASVPLNEAFFLFGDYTSTDSDFSFRDNTGLVIPGNADVKRVNLGGGFVMPMASGADLVIRGAYSDIDLEEFGFGASPSTGALNDLTEDPSDGYFADVSWRAQWTEAMEGSLGVRYTDIEAADGLSFVGNVLFELSPNWGINLQIDAGDELITYGAGVRMTF